MSLGGRYKLRNKLGEGGMGEVYAARDRLTGTTVALKRVLYDPNNLMFSSRLAHPPESNLLRMLANEFRMLASLRHPHIISVLDYGFDAERFPFYTMTLIENPRTIVEAAQSFSLPQRINAFAQMLQALAYLHRRGILHRDLKPANVLVDQHNNVKLLDFGLATQENTHGASGTLAYMPPEVIQQQQTSIQSDLFSLGIVAYELFADRYPFSAQSPNELIHQLLRQMPDMEFLPLNLTPVITRMIMKDPADRYPDADAILADLAAVTDNSITVEDATLRESFLQAASFVGRARELALLTGSLDQIIASQGSGSAFLIGGESGVGKSRLLDELRTHALLNGALVLNGQSIAGSGHPFHMWRDIVRRLLLESEVTDLEAGVLREIVPDIADLLAREVPTLPVLEGISSQSRLIEAILGLFQRQTQPVVLIAEDLHWGQESIAPLQRLSKIVKTLPLLIVGSYRNDEAPTLPNQLPAMQTLTLSRFTLDEIADLSRAVIGTPGEQETVVDYLSQQSEGNALFLVEVIRALAEDAGSMRDIGTKTLPQQIFAGGIERVIVQRLQRLPAEAAPMLQLAAVAGRIIDERLLHKLVGSEAERWLQAGMNAAIVEVVDAQWRFAHDRLRDAVISMIPVEQLPYYHQRIAEALELLYPDDLSLANTLYAHWRAAGNVEKEIYYAAMVIEQRLTLGLLNEANQLLERAMMHKSTDPHVQLKLYRLEGDIYYDLGKNELSSEAFAETLKLARQLNQPQIMGLALEGLGRTAFNQGNYDTALQRYQESLELRRSIGDEHGIGSSLHSISILYRFRSQPQQARDALAEGIAIQRRIGDVYGLAYSLYQLAVQTRLQGNYHEAIGYLQEGIELRRKIGNGRGLVEDLNNLGICYTLVGEYEQAHDTLMESLNLRLAADNYRGAASSQNGLGELFLATEQYKKAIHVFASALAKWYKADDRWNIANSHASVGYAQARARESFSAQHHLYEGLELAQKMQIPMIMLKASIGWAQIMLHDQQQTQAAVLLGAIDVHPAVTAQLRQIYFTPVAAQLDRESYSDDYALGTSTDFQGLVRMILAEAKID